MTTALAHLALPQAVFASPAASILLPVTLGAAVGYSTKPDPKDRSLRNVRQPPFRPPRSAFAPVWTALYALTGYATHRVLGGTGADRAPSAVAGLYTVQLGLNLAWMPLFFVLRRPVAATVDAVLLLGINAYLAGRWLGASTAPVSSLWSPSPRDNGAKTAGWLWLPYVGWLAFVTYLSAGAGHLNGWVLGRPSSSSSSSSSSSLPSTSSSSTSAAVPPGSSSSHSSSSTSSSSKASSKASRHRSKGKGKARGSGSGSA